MRSPGRLLRDAETFLDRIKIDYKWRTGRWHHLQLLAYRGYGTRTRVYVRGRVLDDKLAAMDGRHETIWENVANTFRRIETDEIPGARVRIRFYGSEVEVQTDDDGFFEADLEPSRPPENTSWHEAHLELIAPVQKDGKRIEATAGILIPQEDIEFGIISDLDDTVIRTGAADRLQYIRTMLLNNAHSHLAFDGVAAFYRALQHGPDGQGHNPIFYVSRGAWNFYDLHESFMEAHDIPAGPILLRDVGLQEGEKSKEDHKPLIIRKLLETYPDLPFVLVGDSGQKDPEIYRDIAREYPSRIRAVYLRDVTRRKRDIQVQQITGEITTGGIHALPAETTADLAAHALECGLISEAALAEIRAESSRSSSKKEGAS